MRAITTTLLTTTVPQELYQFYVFMANNADQDSYWDWIEEFWLLVLPDSR